MARKDKPPFDEIGHWSEIKLDIVKEYAAAYSKILSARKSPAFHHVYIDGFAGPGVAVSRTTGEFVPGSPLNALLVEPPFKEYYFIDIEAKKIEALEKVAGQRDDIHIFHGDCNQVLLQHVFPNVQYKDFRRGLCLLDPYGLHFNWQVIEAAGRMATIDMFLNFPLLDAQRNVLWCNPEKVKPEQRERMTCSWGDESWRDVAYRQVRGLFATIEEKKGPKAVVNGFRARLGKKAGFAYVPEPIPMRNSAGRIIYYLFFASQKPVAEKIVKDIFKKHGSRGGR